MIISIQPVIDYSVRGLCVRPYPGHPRGCPNFNKKSGCPPSAPKFDQYFDMSQPIYAIINRFDLASHRDRMRLLHPSWSHRQLDCCLYWQGSARKLLSIEIDRFLIDYSGYEINTCPEAMGVNITETLRSIGVVLEWPPVQYTYQVALAGISLVRSLDKDVLICFRT